MFLYACVTACETSVRTNHHILCGQTPGTRPAFPGGEETSSWYVYGPQNPSAQRWPEARDMVWDGRRQRMVNSAWGWPTEQDMEDWTCAETCSVWEWLRTGIRFPQKWKDWERVRFSREPTNSWELTSCAAHKGEERELTGRECWATRSRCSLRGPTWTRGDNFTSKQVSKPEHLHDDPGGGGIPEQILGVYERAGQLKQGLLPLVRLVHHI